MLARGVITNSGGPAMRRIWFVLFALFSMNAVLLSSCPISPPPETVNRGPGEGGGGGGGGSY